MSQHTKPQTGVCCSSYFGGFCHYYAAPIVINTSDQHIMNNSQPVETGWKQIFCSIFITHINLSVKTIVRKSQSNLISTCCDMFYELWMSLWNVTGYSNIDWTSKYRWCKRNLLEPVTEMISCTLLNIVSGRITENSAATIRSHFIVAFDSFVEIKSLEYLVIIYLFDFYYSPAQ